MIRNRHILRQSLDRDGIDGLLITDLANVRYLSGFTGSAGFLMITKRHFIFVTDFRYQEQARKQVKGFTIRIQTVERTEFIKKLTQGYSIRRLGFEGQSINYSTYRKLRAGGLRLKALTDSVETLRLVKSNEEIRYIRTAVQRAENAYKRLQPFIRTGVSEEELAIRFEGFLREEGCKSIPFGVIVASGPMSALPHARPTGRKIRKGELVLFDWGGECNGYYSDMTRTVAVKGRHLGRQQELYDIVLEAHDRAIQAVKPGVKAVVIDIAARDFIKQKGYNKRFGHGTGHGVGLAVHERPVISWQSREIVEKGMVFTIEPGIYLPDFGGIRIEDMVSVGGHGAEVLTALPGKLKIIKG